MHSKKRLGFTPLIKAFGTFINEIHGDGKAVSIDYRVYDIVMPAFACMYMQSTALLIFRKLLKKRRKGNDLASLYQSVVYPMRLLPWMIGSSSRLIHSFLFLETT
jgi:hypothetical protein